MKKIVAFGNPLLDTIVLIRDDFLLKKYNLEKDGQKEITQSDMKSLTEEIREYDKRVTAAGGCAQNTLKVMQWLVKKQFSAAMFGAVGNDNEGKMLKHVLTEHGVQTWYVTQQDHPTGITVSLVSGASRSLVAHIGAAEVISLNDVDSNEEILTLIKNADVIYMEGFFITERVEAATFILKQCNTYNKEFAFNLSGEYICKEYPETVKIFLRKSTIIFGNRREFEAISSVMEHTSADNLVLGLAKQGKTVVMTSGPDPVLCLSNGGDNYCQTEVPKLKGHEIVDTTGAGDSFVAGFLTGYLLEKPLQICAELGCYAAQEIIKREGCTVPEYPSTLII